MQCSKLKDTSGELIGKVNQFETSAGAGDGLLTNISYVNSDSGNTEVCITDTIVSDVNGTGLLSSGDCINVDISDTILGDINNDTLLNVQDVVLLINFVLGSLEPTDSQFYAADMNSDGILNVQDVVILINIILD